MTRPDAVWKSSSLVKQYLHRVRRAVPLAREQIDVMMRLITARSKPVESFLDLGCGDGILSAAILAEYPRAKGVLLDFSRSMINSAEENFSQCGENLVFATLDFADPTWVAAIGPTTPFDVVVSGFSIHHQPDERKRQLFGEIYELLTPGGLFVNVEHVASPTDWIEQVWSDYFIDALYAQSVKEDSGKTRDEVAWEYHQRPDKEANVLAPVEVQCDWLRETGFDDVDYYLKVFELAVFGGRRPT